MRARVVIAVIMVVAGMFLAAVSVLAMIEGASWLNWIIPLGIAGILCIAGFVLLITELLETWLSRGQKALVDGLQAG